MSDFNDQVYDVAIMGGGPAGATLGARLARETDLRVAIFEEEYFPRDHIGESFVHTIVPSLQESGALPKVLGSECYVKKAGGYYAWDPAHPWATYFEHGLSLQDGHLRWSMHVNRPEFDKILLDHARDSGAFVYEGTAVTAVEREPDATRLELGPYGEARARIFVNSSGRTGSTTITGDKAFLSDYRNIAIWNHIVGGRAAQEAPGDWNIFRERNLSPIGSFAFKDGWFWYIPVRKVVQGKRVRTHSLGMVTDPGVIKRDSKSYTDPQVFMETARKVPLLGDLIQDAELVSDKFLTATNYSRISGRMCDWDKREIRIGDAAYFVDPLFSSGVHFALLHAAAAVSLIKTAFDPSVPEALQRELWDDYHVMLRNIARAFALGIDQWYNEIARDQPDSIYWKDRGTAPTFDMRRETFQGLVNGGIHGDLIQVITKGQNSVDALGKEGALRRTLDEIGSREPGPEALVRLRPGVAIKDSLTLEAGGKPTGRPPVFVHGPYWDDPDAHAEEVAPLFGEPRPCHRLYFEDGEREDQVSFVEEEHRGLELVEALKSGTHAYGALKDGLSPAQQHLLLHLVLADMVAVEAPAAS